MSRSGNLYVSQQSGGYTSHVTKLSPTDSVLATYNTRSPALYTAPGVALDSYENLYVADTAQNRVVVFASTEAAESMQFAMADSVARRGGSVSAE